MNGLPILVLENCILQIVLWPATVPHSVPGPCLTLSRVHSSSAGEESIRPRQYQPTRPLQQNEEVLSDFISLFLFWLQSSITGVGMNVWRNEIMCCFGARGLLMNYKKKSDIFPGFCIGIDGLRYNPAWRLGDWLHCTECWRYDRQILTELRATTPQSQAATAAVQNPGPGARVEGHQSDWLPSCAGPRQDGRPGRQTKHWQTLPEQCRASQLAIPFSSSCPPTDLISTQNSGDGLCDIYGTSIPSPCPAQPSQIEKEAA